jgi:hypothetical protein
VTEVRGAGSCLWGVGLSADRRYLVFQDERAANPGKPNAWGAGEWRVFDMQERKLLPAPPKDFDPVRPLEKLDGWSVDTSRPYEWVVERAAEGSRFKLTGDLYDKDQFSLPRCYTFLEPAGEGRPPRLAVGHTWGVSLYELPREEKPRLVRLMIGHEGEVMALGPSRDGKILVTAGRDQTVAGWSLGDWKGTPPGEPCHPELGAGFKDKDGLLEVRRLEPGSPAWETGLEKGDEIVLMAVWDKNFLFNPLSLDLKKEGLTDHGKGAKAWDEWNAKDALKELDDARPGREILFVWRRHGEKVPGQRTMVYQRPLWKFFPTRDNAWVLWRWRDFYYDTNSAAAAASFVGWHINGAKLNDKPEFLPLRSQEKKRYQPGKVQAALGDFVKDHELVQFVDLELPDVKLAAEETGLVDQDLKLKLTAQPRKDEPEQAITSVSLWVNDYQFPYKHRADGKYDGYPVDVPADNLRVGTNRITLIAYNKAGGRREDVVSVEFKTRRVAQGKLYGLCVGVDDYTGLGGEYQKGKEEDLRGAVRDAKGMRGLLLGEAGGRLFRQAELDDVVLLTEGMVTAEAVRGKLRQLAKKVTAQDTFVLFLAGHGIAEEKEEGGYDPATWFYVCANTDSRDKETRLTGKQLHEALAALKCRKLVFLDTCHSGAVAAHVYDPSDSLTRECPAQSPPLIFSACKLEESSLDDGTHGIFTRCLLSALRYADSNDNNLIDARELAEYLRREVPLRHRTTLALARKGREARELADVVAGSQHPVVFPLPPPSVPLFSKRQPPGGAE